MSAPASLPSAERPRSRTVELVLAHVHLRLGSLALARVELESLAGLGRLDSGGLVDLAEVRWRTGDLLGAGEAAVAALRDEERDPIALVIAAEAAAARGRPTEARRLASLALAGTSGSIDLIFAGMPRSGGWPGDAAEPPPTAPTLFDREPEPPGRVDARDALSHDGEPAERTGATSPAAPVALGFWDGEPSLEPASATMPDPGSELDAGRAALMAGRVEEAAFHFSIALRLAPALAPAVLEATSGARGPSLTMVRGDAYRFAGHEEEARQAYAIAAQGGLPERRTRPRPRQKTRVATPTDAAAEDADIATDTESEVGTDVIAEDAADTAADTAATEDGTDAAAEVEADAIIDADVESADVHADPTADTTPPEDADAPEEPGDDEDGPVA